MGADKHSSRSRSASKSRSRSRSESRSRSRSRSASRDRSPALDRHGNPRRSPRRQREARESRRDAPRRDADRPHKTNDKPSRVIGVFGMSYRTDEREIEYKCSKYGKVENVVLIWNNQLNRSKGYAFVTFEDIEDAKDCVEKMNGKEIDGREVRVDFSFTQQGHKRDERRRDRSRSRDRRRRSRSRDRRRRSRSGSYDRRRRR